jgi:hypothetical protein
MFPFQWAPTHRILCLSVAINSFIKAEKQAKEITSRNNFVEFYLSILLPLQSFTVDRSGPAV